MASRMPSRRFASSCFKNNIYNVWVMFLTMPFALTNDCKDTDPCRDSVTVSTVVFIYFLNFGKFCLIGLEYTGIKLECWIVEKNLIKTEKVSWGSYSLHMKTKKVVVRWGFSILLYAKHVTFWKICVLFPDCSTILTCTFSFHFNEWWFVCLHHIRCLMSNL